LIRIVVASTWLFSLYVLIFHFTISAEAAISTNNTNLLNKTLATALNKTLPLLVNKTIAAAANNATSAAVNATAAANNATSAAVNATAAANKAASAAVNATNKPANSTQIAKTLLGDNPAETAIRILQVMGLVILIPLVADLLLAYRRQSKQAGKGSATDLVGMPGLYRALMTFGILIMVGAIVFYVIGLVTINISMAGQQAFTALTNTLTNLASILGTALATVIAFYFGTRATEKAVEKTLSRAGTPTGDTIPPEVTNTIPPSGATGVQVNSPITATFSEPIRSSTITPNTFVIKDSQGNRTTGIITISEDKKVVIFTPEPSLKDNNTEYTVTITKAVTDIAGNTMTSDKVWTFQTV
jgi:Bacterial Ig-like domain